jgi:hypothetical protein
MAGAGVQGREPDTLVTIDKLKSESKNAFQLEFTLRNFAPIEPIPVSWEYPIYKPDNDLQGLKIEGGKSRPETVSTDDVLLEWNNLRGDGYTVTKKLLAEQLACGPRTIELKIKELKKKNCLYNLRLDGKGNVVGEVPDLSNMIAPDPATLPTQENLLRNMGGL